MISFKPILIAICVITCINQNQEVHAMRTITPIDTEKAGVAPRYSFFQKHRITSIKKILNETASSPLIQIFENGVGDAHTLCAQIHFKGKAFSRWLLGDFFLVRAEKMGLDLIAKVEKAKHHAYVLDEDTKYIDNEYFLETARDKLNELHEKLDQILEEIRQDPEYTQQNESLRDERESMKHTVDMICDAYADYYHSE